MNRYIQGNIISEFKRIILFSLLGLSYGLFSYYYFGGWWNSSAGTSLILFFSYLIWGRDFPENTGLKMKLKTIVQSIILAGIITLSALLLMKYIAVRHNVLIEFTHWRNYYHDIFYILNEEIVLGAILLFRLVNTEKIQPIIACIGLAVFFALIHFVFYQWVFNDRGTLGVITFITLFMVGFTRNSLILLTGHIGYSWALHFGWMVIMFGCMHIDLYTKFRVTEPERFNLYLGSSEMLIISSVLAGLCLLYWIKKHNPRLIKDSI